MSEGGEGEDRPGVRDKVWDREEGEREREWNTLAYWSATVADETTGKF